MSDLSHLIVGASAASGAAGLLYAAIVTTAALTALLARTPVRRRDAREVLKILLRRRSRRP
jgi:hypothetical protein